METALKWLRSPGWELRILGIAAVVAIHFASFYWWASSDHYFAGDSLFYFSRQITSFADVWQRLISVDELYQYRPLPYFLFSLILFPLFGTEAAPYHLASYLIVTVNALLSSACVFFWTGRNKRMTVLASVFLLLNPVNFFPSYGPTYIDVYIAVLFYYLALVFILSGSKRASWLAPLFSALALLSRESSIVLPIQAMLILIVRGESIRRTVSRTRNIWLVAAIYTSFQMVIRSGALFAPIETNPNMAFGFSFARVAELVRGAKVAIFYPENYHLSALLHEMGRPVRLAFLAPWIILILWRLFRRDKLALSGLLWASISLLPIAFIQVGPEARHYYLAVPGLAILFATITQRTQMIAFLAAILAFVTITNVALYAEESWIATGAKLTRMYLGDIQRTADRTGLNEFYVLDSGDQHFYWHIDGGASLKYFLRGDFLFRFASSRHPLPMDRLLANQINVVIPTWSGLREAIKTGEFPKLAQDTVCAEAGRFVRSAGPCAVFFRGIQIREGAQRTSLSNHTGLFGAAEEEVVTLSRTTVFLSNVSGVRLQGSATLSSESTDGVSFQVFTEVHGWFHSIVDMRINPGETIELAEMIHPTEASVVVLRIGPGPKGEEEGDRLVWQTSSLR